MPSPAISQHRRNLGGLSRYHQHSTNMEKNNDKPMPTTQTRIYTNPTIKDSESSVNKTIPNPHERDGTPGIFARRALQVPPSRHRTKKPTSRKTQVNVSPSQDQS